MSKMLTSAVLLSLYISLSFSQHLRPGEVSIESRPAAGQKWNIWIAGHERHQRRRHRRRPSTDNGHCAIAIWARRRCASQRLANSDVVVVFVVVVVVVVVLAAVDRRQSG
jgi:hypothetical protein